MAWPSSSTFVAANVLTAAQLNALRADLLGVNGYVRKTLDEDVTSSTVLQNDNELAIAIPGAGTYVIDVRLKVVSAANAAGDIRVGADFPTGTCEMFMSGLDSSLASGAVGTLVGAAASLTSGVDPGLSFGASTFGVFARVEFLLVATASGTFQFRWAQTASSASATTVKAGSFLTMRQVA